MSYNSEGRFRLKSPIVWAEQFSERIGPASARGVEAYLKDVPVFDEFDSPTQTAYRVVTDLGIYKDIYNGWWVIYGHGGGRPTQVLTDFEFKRLYEKVDPE